MSLVECVAALLVLGMGALAGMELVALSVRAGDGLQRSATANCLLAGRLEQLLALAWDDPALTPGGSLSDSLPGYFEDVTIDGRAWRIHCQVSSEFAGGKLVTLRLVPLTAAAVGRPGTRLSAWVVR